MTNILIFSWLFFLAASVQIQAQGLIEKTTGVIDRNTFLNSINHHFVDHHGVKLHYVSKGEGPVVLFVHGFPDFWYGWRTQIEALSGKYQVAVVDLRGYNKSDGPDGAENYTFEILVEDLVSVIRDLGGAPVYLVAHDWGAAIAWRLAARHPALVKKLIILSISHPKAGDKIKPIPLEDRKPSYADHFVSDQFRAQLTASWFSAWVVDPEARILYQEAFEQSNPVGMIHYYSANFPTLENQSKPDFLNRKRDLPNIKMPVLIVHGKKDKYAPTQAHNNSWDFVDGELTIVVLPKAGHFIQQDESEKLTALIKKFISED